MPARFLARRYLGRRMLVLAGLGFGSGLPSSWKALGSTLQAWLKDVGVDVATVTLLSLVTLPVGLKVLWAPALDRVRLPFLGRRRGWLLVLQGGTAGALLAMAAVGPEAEGAPLGPLVAAALLLAVLSASQDVVADAYRADVLPAPERAAGAAMFVNGYRIALVAAGGGALLLSEVLPWRAVYACLAAGMALGVVATWLGEEPPEPAGRPATWRAAVEDPFADLARRLGAGTGAVLAFIALFRVPDALAGVITTPFLLEGLRFAKSDVAWVREWYGLAVSIAGALAAGPLVARLGLRRSLLVFGVLQAASNLGFAALAATGGGMPGLLAVVTVENLCQGLVAAGFVAYLMALCDPRWSATQYALFTGVMFLAGTLLSAPMGGVVEARGWGPAFALSALAGLPGLLLLPLLPAPPEDAALRAGAGD